MKKTKIITTCLFLLTFFTQAAQAEMPGMRGIQHLGITVPNVKAATAFFKDVIGCESFFSIGPFGPFDNDWMTENLNVDKKAVIKTAHLMRCGNGPALEIFEYSAQIFSDKYSSYLSWQELTSS